MSKQHATIAFSSPTAGDNMPHCVSFVLEVTMVEQATSALSSLVMDDNMPRYVVYCFGGIHG